MRLWRIFVRRKHFVIILTLLGTALNAHNLIMDPDRIVTTRNRANLQSVKENSKFMRAHRRE